VAIMKLDQKDPSCPTCIPNTTVELISGSPCQIKVHVVLAPPPSGTTFPSPGENVTYAALRYSDDDGNTATKELGAPTGPAYGSWDSAATFTVTFNAAAWLTQGDFENTAARLEIATDARRTVYQWWLGVEA
jgi:hypothetical protein